MAMNGLDARAATDVFFSVFSFRTNWVKLSAIQFAQRGTGAAAVAQRLAAPWRGLQSTQRLTALHRPRRAIPVLRIGGCGGGQT